jgi:imidazoleglycerol phosphate synthase cyclase subunit
MKTALVVSSSEKAAAYIREMLASTAGDIVSLASCNEARRMLLERDFNLVVVNAPLKDETGENFSRYVASKSVSQIILIVNAEIFDAVSSLCENDGVLMVSKPVNSAVFWASIKLAGAEKISIDSMAVRNPQIIAEGAKAFGSQCIVLSTQVKRSRKMPSGYEVYIDGARLVTGLDALEWLKRGQQLGAGEVCLNSIDCDGTLKGYDLPLMKMAEENLSIPLIASGGAGAPRHLEVLFRETEAQAAIISSMLYSPRMEKNYTCGELKRYLSQKGINMRN